MEKSSKIATIIPVEMPIEVQHGFKVIDKITRSLQDRMDLSSQIRELQNTMVKVRRDKKMVEKEMKKILVEEGLDSLLNVNWTGVYRMVDGQWK